ncbi:hypothetical protein [Mycobacteroides abscessus]|uniref:hypothetical protein n=1 Tax=Mycobacteroides abscessus TaxID=36809 RepID=UPI0010425B17|nr:hypothetical protein [Mycobacteroides abscessus]
MDPVLIGSRMPAPALALRDEFQVAQFETPFVGTLDRSDVGAHSCGHGLLAATERISVAVYELDCREPQHALIGQR